MKDKDSLSQTSCIRKYPLVFAEKQPRKSNDETLAGHKQTAGWAGGYDTFLIYCLL